MPGFLSIPIPKNSTKHVTESRQEVIVYIGNAAEENAGGGVVSSPGIALVSLQNQHVVLSSATASVQFMM